MNAPALFRTARRYRIARRPPESILPSAPRPMRRDCHGRLIVALLDQAGPESVVADSTITAWASATFIGARHGVTMVLSGVDATIRAEALRIALPEADFALPGHIVADLSVDSLVKGEDPDGVTEVALTLSILTIEAW